MTRKVEQAEGPLVPVVELADSVGYGHVSGAIQTALEAEGAAVVPDWRGRPSVTVEVAASFYERKTAEKEALSEANWEYQKYLDAKREEAAEKIRAERRAEKEEVKAKRRAYFASVKEQQPQKVAEMERKRQAEAGNPEPFDAWRKKQ